MRPFLERLIQPADASVALLDRRLEEAIPFQWHHHPEMELTLTLNSVGQRFVGDHVGRYEDGDLVLVGPNLPHTWASEARLDPGRPHRALVAWFRYEWIEALAETSAELRPVLRLVRQARQGLRFSDGAAAGVAGAIQSLHGASPPRRLLGLLDVLGALAGDEAAEILAQAPALAPGGREGRDRVDRVLTCLHDRYADGVSLDDLAEVAALSPSGLHRLFRRQVGATISEYLLRLRLGDACARLSGTREPIGHVAVSSGFGTAGNFNRHFLRAKGVTPQAYRAAFRARERGGEPRIKAEGTS
jgi:AraC-like DNA-binding protein